MTHAYSITGMTCSGCQAKVQTLLSGVEGVQEAAVNLEKGEAVITMNKHIDTSQFQAALKNYPKYQLSEKAHHPVQLEMKEKGAEQSWLVTYKPILLIAFYLLLTTLSAEIIAGSFGSMRWMSHFMGGFFLTFSFFKLLDLNGFADSYATYDIIAMRWRGWGYVYAFVELLLGLAFLLKLHPLLTNMVAFAVMSISIIGVLQSVLNKRKIKCACLGAVFNLPMSTVTIIEDGLMIIMSGWMIAHLI